MVLSLKLQNITLAPLLRPESFDKEKCSSHMYWCTG